MGSVLDQRRVSATERIEELLSHLTEASRLATGKACVYATGSYGRGEPSHFSDLDLFIVGQGTRDERLLSALDEMCIKAGLIVATRNLGIQDFSGDGLYLNHYTVDELIGTLGQPEDDVSNTFTARLLLLLESRPLLGEDVYSDVIDQVVTKYWRDYEDHKTDFLPAFLANDVLRLWRTFCVNYEARTLTEPEEKRAKRKLKNYKLKHSRLLTCFSALIYLLAIYERNRTVTPNDAVNMVKMSPTKRLEWLKEQKDFERAHSSVDQLLESYEQFLQRTDESETDLVSIILDSSKGAAVFHSANELGDTTFELLKALGTEISGEQNRLYRLLVV